MLRSLLEILGEPDTNPIECTSFDVEKAYLTLDLYSLLLASRINMQIVKLKMI